MIPMDCEFSGQRTRSNCWSLKIVFRSRFFTLLLKTTLLGKVDVPREWTFSIDVHVIWSNYTIIDDKKNLELILERYSTTCYIFSINWYSYLSRSSSLWIHCIFHVILLRFSLHVPYKAKCALCPCGTPFITVRNTTCKKLTNRRWQQKILKLLPFAAFWILCN